jgi:hypothetical protein
MRESKVEENKCNWEREQKDTNDGDAGGSDGQKNAK